jgi:hypothetical protein
MVSGLELVGRHRRLLDRVHKVDLWQLEGRCVQASYGGQARLRVCVQEQAGGWGNRRVATCW